MLNASNDALKVYGVTNRQWLNGRSLADVVQEAIIGGATIIQLREKYATNDEFIALATEVKCMTDHYHVPLIINDNLEVALAIDADGIHVGQDDLSADTVRQQLGFGKIMGVSVQTIEQALRAEAQGADYLGVGTMFNTATKADAIEVSIETLTAICHTVNIPVVAIGGITAQNIPQLSGSGIVGVAVVSSIFAATDIIAATKNITNAVDGILA